MIHRGGESILILKNCLLLLVFNIIKIIISLFFIGSTKRFIKVFSNISLVKVLLTECAYRLLLYALRVYLLKNSLIFLYSESWFIEGSSQAVIAIRMGSEFIVTPSDCGELKKPPKCRGFGREGERASGATSQDPLYSAFASPRSIAFEVFPVSD